ncbi:MAG: cellulose synthase operon protein YhjQ [Candidimonas sp.]|nr:MAG: cellulose synthase operon protein YhjQ [Candidimonas sp.]
MKIVAFVSVCGGVGKTSLVSALAVLLARAAQPVVVVELDPQNVLGTFLGLARAPATGLASRALDGGSPWRGATYRSADGVLFVPFGDLDADRLLDLEGRLAADPGWLSAHIAQIDLPDHGMVLLDAARFPGTLAALAMRSAHEVICVTRPEPVACAALLRFADAQRCANRAFRILANGVHPARPLHYDVLALLRARLGRERVMTPRVHEDASIPESYAKGQYCFDACPRSQAAHDLRELADWLCAPVAPGV